MKKIGLLLQWVVCRILWMRGMATLGRWSVIHRPILIANPQYIHIGSHTQIRDHARLEVVVRPALDHTPSLVIGNHVNIEQGVHIICQGQVIIEDHVSITPYCVIVDTDHPIDNPDRLPKIGSRLNDCKNTRVRIGEGSFIGAHSVILPGVDIGRGCIIGAGSVVTKNIPDYCIASGAPARLIKRFDLETRTWNAQNP